MMIVNHTSIINTLNVVGIGIGGIENMTIKAYKILNDSKYIYADNKNGEIIRNHFPNSKFIINEYNQTTERCQNALKNSLSESGVSIIGSGDVGIYGISGIIYKMRDEGNYPVKICVIPGITSFIAGASLLGAPIVQDFVVLSLSDEIADKNYLFEKIQANSRLNLTMIFYSPCNPSNSNLTYAIEILRQNRDPQTCVGVVKNIGQVEEERIITTLDDLDIKLVNAQSVVYIGNSHCYMSNNKMISPLI